MRIRITPPEVRVLGSLIEKDITTPDQYPLSLSALTQACNQKSSRDPVMQMKEEEVQAIVEGLIKKHLISDRGGFGSRVTKYQHRFCNQGFGSLEFSPQELGVICVLLLRGPQTPGELRTRTNRLCKFSDVRDVEQTLHSLMERDDGPFAVRLAREPGKRDSRFSHLFSGEPEALDTHKGTDDQSTHRDDPQRPVEELEALLLELQEQLEALEARVTRLEG